MRRALVLAVLCSTVATSPLWAQTATPTDTPTETPPASSTPTSTPTPSATCNGTRVSFPILASSHDGYLHGQRVIYAPNSCSSTSTTSDIQIQRSKTAFNLYQTDVGFVCFNTATLGPGATVLEAKLNVETGRFGNADTRNLVGEWMAHGPPFSCLDWASVSAATAFSVPISGLHIVKDLIDPALTTPTTVNRFGYTCLRLHIDGLQPTGINRVNLVSFDTFGGGGLDPTLDVCYTTAPTPTGALPTATPTHTPTPLWIDHFGGSGGDVGYAVTTVDAVGNPVIGGFFSAVVPNFGGTPVASVGTDAFVAKYNSAGVFQWITHTGNVGSNSTMSVATDAAGNVYATGKFQNSINWGCGTLNSALASSYDIFTVKLLGTDGSCVWSHNYGSGNDDIGYGITIDSTGAVLVTGEFLGHTNVGGANFFSSNTASGPSTFVAKYTSGGVHIWSTIFSQTIAINGPDEGRAIATDSADNVYVTGYFQGTEYFDQVTATNSVAVSPDIYVAKFTSGGTFVRRDVYGAGGTDIGFGITTDSAGNIAIAGEFANSVDFGGGAYPAGGALAGFIASYTPSGTHRWSRPLSSATTVAVNGIIADKSTGEVVTTGQFVGSVDFGGGALTSAGVAGASDIFIAKYFSDGTYENAVSYGASAADVGYSVALDPIHNIYATGFFSGSVNFGGAGVAVSNGSTDIFLVKLDPPLDALPASTATVTPMPTNTPTQSGSPTLTHTAMPTNSPTVSPTPSTTPTPSVTPTRTPTPNIHRLLIQMRRIELIPF